MTKAAEADTLEQLLADQYDAFAATIVKNNSADDALDQLLEPALYGKGKTLYFTESDPIIATIFGSEFFRESFLHSMPQFMDYIHPQKLDRALVGGSVSWYDYGLSSHAQIYTWNETTTIDDDDMQGFGKSIELHKGATNRNDTALSLVVGTLTYRIRMTRLRADFDSVTYKLEFIFQDKFSFEGDYSDASDAGFDTTFSDLLNIFGSIFGLKTYQWYATADFEITFPNPCTHSSGSYRWEKQGNELVPVSSEGYSSLPLEKRTKDGTDSTFYYRLSNPVILSASQPWSIEFQIPGNQYFSLSGFNYISHSPLPALRKTEVVELVKYSPRTTAKGSQYFDQNIHYCADNAPLSDKQLHIYRLENRIDSAGNSHIFLLIDGQEIGAFSNYKFLNRETMKETLKPDDPDWFNDTYMAICRIFNVSFPFYETMPLEYLEIRSGAEETVSFVTSRVTEATCSTPGTEVRSCILCDAEETIQLDNLAEHTEQILPGKAPSCTETGLTEGKQCTVCNKILVSQETIPAAEHKELTLSGNPATCTEEGLTEGTICGECDQILRQQNPFPALDHTFSQGSCTRCQAEDPDWILPGDADGNKTLNYQDALLILRATIGLETLSEKVCNACDLDGNGKLTYNDALIILRRSIGA